MISGCRIHSLGCYVPEMALTNNDIAQFVDTTDQWIVERTGIHARRKLAAHENTSDMGIAAAKQALAKAGIGARELTHVMVATCTPDYLTPSVACIIAGAIGAGSVMAFDMGAACTGFIYGMSLCGAMLEQDKSARILFVCAEALTRRLNWEDRSTCVLFGDGAVAAVVSADEAGAICGLRDVICQSDGGLHELITIGGGTACQCQPGHMVKEDFFLVMQGRDTYRHAVRQMVNVCQEILRRNDLTMDDIDLFVPHQANMRIIEAVGARLGANAGKVFCNLGDYGNTSAASIPLALCEAHDSGRIAPGATVLVTAFGAGLTFGAALLNF